MVDAGVTMVTMANIESTEVQEVLGLKKTEAVREDFESRSLQASML